MPAPSAALCKAHHFEKDDGPERLCALKCDGTNMTMGEKEKDSFLERLRQGFRFLETEFGYSRRDSQDPRVSEVKGGWYVVTFGNPAINRSLQVAAPARMKKHINVILYCVAEPESVRIRDVEKYLPVKQLRAFYAPQQYRSSDYIGQLVGFDKALENFKAVLAESQSLLDGSAWIDRGEFDRKLFETGKFRYGSSAERFAFIDKARSAFAFLEEELGYEVTAASDMLAAYEDNNPSQEIGFANQDKDSAISVFYDQREEFFGIKLYRYASSLNCKKDYEIFNALNIQEEAGYRFLDSAASNLWNRLLESQ